MAESSNELEICHGEKRYKPKIRKQSQWQYQLQ